MPCPQGSERGGSSGSREGSGSQFQRMGEQQACRNSCGIENGAMEPGDGPNSVPYQLVEWSQTR